MEKQTKKSNKLEERKDWHHLGSPNVFEAEYNSENMEYMITFSANGSNTTFLGEHVQNDDLLYLGLSEEDAENLCEQLITAISDRLKNKLERFNLLRKVYYIKELNGTEEEWEESNWNAFSK